MSPLCTGNSDHKGVWPCPYCKPCSVEKVCYSLYNTPNGLVEVPCKSPCNRSVFHASSPGELWEHVKSVHRWDGISLEKSPDRLLDGPLPRSVVPLLRKKGPSAAARKKARKRRRKKNKK